MEKFILDKVPKGWKLLEGALTAPKGTHWYSNGKSLWDKNYDHVLVADEEDEEEGESDVAT